jgi:hypothetical protein
VGRGGWVLTSLLCIFKRPFLAFALDLMLLDVGGGGGGSLGLFCASSRGPSLHLPLISCYWINLYWEMCLKVWCVAFTYSWTHMLVPHLLLVMVQ